ncbi:MAG: hypothetical protein WBG17_01815 [Burkholderiaceae bacterium]
MEYLLGLIVVVAAAMLLRRYLYGRPIKFKFDGQRYIRMPDKSFCNADGTPIADTALAAGLQAYWQAMERSAEGMDTRDYD